MDDLQTLIERLQIQTGSSVIDLRYRPEEEGPNWAVIIDWGSNYMAVVPTSIRDNPIDSLKTAMAYLEQQKTTNR